MLKGRGWFGGGLWKPKNPHSLEHLRYLYTILSKNQVVQDSNRGLLVETLRSIAEILIWGDQNDSSVFDFFLEKNMLSFFLRIMKQKCGSYVCVQLLQTLNILFENIRNETSLYYLLSNNHVNSIIVHKFDFSDEEVMAYYISFLKTLSLKLNGHTIHFFYNEHTNDFPLYTEAIKFFNHPESMVRIAVRTLTLNVYRVDDRSMLQFIRDKTAAPYFSNLVWFIGNHILELDNCVCNDVDHNSRDRLADLVGEHLDHLHYLNDILRLDITALNEVLADHLLNRLLVPLLVYSLNTRKEGQEDKPRVSSVVSLFLLSQVFLIVTYTPLIRALAKIILHGDNSVFTDTSTIVGPTSVRRAFIAPEETLEKSLEAKIVNSRSASGLSQSSSQGSREHDSTPERTDSGPIRLHQLSPANGEVIHTNYTDTEAEEAAYCSDLRVSNSVADISTSAGISDLEATRVNITDEEKEHLRSYDASGCAVAEVSGKDLTLKSRPFLQIIFSALDCSENDYAALFALCLLYALGHNPGINQELLDSVQIPGENCANKAFYNNDLVEKIIQIISLSCQYNSKIRVATLEMSLLVLKQLVLVTASSDSYRGAGSNSGCPASVLRDQHFAAVEGAREEATLLLRNFFKSEEIFLDMFEDEWREMRKRPLNVEYLLQDASVLLPPAGTPLTGIDFNKRLPCGEVERARRAIRVFFLLRDISLLVRGEQESHLPLTNPAACVQVSDVLDLNNSDLIACMVVTKDGQRTRRFLVIDVIQLILVEPDTKRLGWGVAKFVGFLQDLEVTGDKDDSRALHLTIQHPSSSTNTNRAPLLAARFNFDDHIRCMAAKQRLTKGRFKARQRKMHMIAKLLELPSHLQPCPSPPTHAHALHTMRQEAHRRGWSRGNVDGGRSRSQQPVQHRPLFTLNKVPGFALKREAVTPQGGVEGSDGTHRHRSESQSPSRNSHHRSPRNLPAHSTSRASTSGASHTEHPHHQHPRRSSSRPRPRSEEIPMEDMMVPESPRSSPLLPKIPVGRLSSPRSSSSSAVSSTSSSSSSGVENYAVNEGSQEGNMPEEAPKTGKAPISLAQITPSVATTHLLPALPAFPVLHISSPFINSTITTPDNTGICTTNMQSSNTEDGADLEESQINSEVEGITHQKQDSEKETSFTASPKVPSTSSDSFDVFESQINGSVEKQDQQSTEKEENRSGHSGTGSSDFSPLRRLRVKGSVETV